MSDQTAPGSRDCADADPWLIPDLDELVADLWRIEELLLTLAPGSELADVIEAGAEAAYPTRSADPSTGVELVETFARINGLLDLATTADTEMLTRRLWADGCSDIVLTTDEEIAYTRIAHRDEQHVDRRPHPRPLDLLTRRSTRRPIIPPRPANGSRRARPRSSGALRRRPSPPSSPAWLGDEVSSGGRHVPRSVGTVGHVTDPTIGSILARLRRQAGLSQAQLAVRAGVSVDLIKKLEQGRRHSCSLPTVQALAAVLDVDPGTLLGRPTPLRDAGPFSGAVAIRRALTSVDDLIGTADSVEPWTIDQGRRTVAHLWAAYWAGHYEALGQLLPSGIAQSRAMTRAVPDGQRPEAHDLAAQIHQVSACTLVHLGYGDVSHLALREGLRLAELGHDPLRVTSLQGSLSWLLLTQGRARESRELAAAIAARMNPRDDPTAQALYGSMLLTAANAAGRTGDRAGAQPYLTEAGAVAARTGNRLDYQTPFGPDQHRMQTVDVDIVTESYTEALDAAALMPEHPDLPTAARARHGSDVALAHLRLGHDEQALDTLLRIEEMAPSWMRFQAQPRMVTADLLRRAQHPPRLAALAERVGVLAPAE